MAKKMIRPPRTEAEYEAAVDEIERYFENEPRRGTPEADRFDLLALVIEDYEKKRWPIDPPDPVEAIRFRMQTGGYSQADLGRLLGSRQRATENHLPSPWARLKRDVRLALRSRFAADTTPHQAAWIYEYDVAKVTIEAPAIADATE